MKYSITGRNQQNGQQSTFVVEAESEVDAVAQASQRGYGVEKVLLIPETPGVGVQYNGVKPASGNGFAITALVLGIVGVIAACLPICGFPINILGIVFGILGRKSQNRKMAVAGLILSCVGMAITIINGAIGAFMAINGTHPFIKP